MNDETKQAIIHIYRAVGRMKAENAMRWKEGAYCDRSRLDEIYGAMDEDLHVMRWISEEYPEAFVETEGEGDE